MSIATISAQTTVGQLVADKPSRSRLFQKLGIDFCCGGKKPLAEACAGKGIDVNVVLACLESEDSAPDPAKEVDAASMGLAELADHIVRRHHNYLRAELPRLEAMIARVAQVHGETDPRLTQLPVIFNAFRQELADHMYKEEQILFPLVKQMEGANGPVSFHCGSVANPIRVMEMEHDNAGNALAQLRGLTDGFVPPAQACNTYRAMLHGLAELESDMHQHVHKENNVLFPRAIEMEARLARA